MPIKLSTCAWLFNCDLRILREGHGDIAHHPDRLQELRKICEEYDQMEFFEDTANVTNPIIGENVFLSGYTEHVSIPKDKSKLKELLLGVHEVVGDIRVSADIYRRIGEIFKEYDFPMDDEELRVATEIASGIRRDDYSRLLSFNAKAEVHRVQAQGKERF